MTTESGLRSVGGDYATHVQMWEEIRACNKGAKEVVKLVSSMPAPSYTTTCGVMKYDHLEKDLLLQAQNLEHNRNLTNIQRINEYWKRGRFFNAVGRTVESFHGMIWNNPAEPDIAPNMEPVTENITGTGKGIDDLAKDITYELIMTGRYGALADMAGSDRQLTSAEQDSPQFRPKAITYLPEQILSVHVTDGMVADIRLDETKMERDVENKFLYKCVKYTRRLAIEEGVYVNELYDDKDKLIEISIPRASGQPFTEIPFVFFGSDSNTPEYSKPPMFDLAHINLGHFVLDCDNRDNLHFHGQGTTVVTTDMEPHEFDAFNPAGLDTGAKGKNVLKQGDDIKLVQLDATGAIPSEMERDQERMIQAGAQVVQSSSSTMTLGQKKIESGSSLSTLARISHNTTAGINRLLEYLAMFAGVTQESTYKVNAKFITDELTPEMLNAQIAMVQGGVLPQSTLNESARRVGFTKDDDEKIQEKLMEEGQSLTGDSEEVAALKAEIDALKAAAAGE